jgi:peptidoglycan biosynthesis protein MviN/MurJ (putative lipid II flippase)
VVGVALASSLAYTLIMALFHLGATKSVGRLLTRATWLFMAKVLLGNLLTYALALWLADLLQPAGTVVVLAAQAAAVLVPNICLARSAPLRLTLRSALRA